MNRRAFGVFGVLLIALAAVSVNAQSSNYAMRVNVPFDFTIENTLLQKGVYTVRQSNYLGCYTVQGPKGLVFVYTHQTTRRMGEDTNKLVFHRINDQYFLASIWASGDRIGHELFRSRREREMIVQLGAPVLRTLTASVR